MTGLHSVSVPPPSAATKPSGGEGERISKALPAQPGNPSPRLPTGSKPAKEDWKHVLPAALYQQDVVPNIDGNGFVVLGKSTSRMTVREMRDLIELAQSFGAEQGVKFGDESRRGFDWVAAYGRAAA